MMADVISDAVTGLQAARDQQAEVVARETAKLSQLDSALAGLRDQILVVDPANLPRKRDFDGLGIVEAAKRWLTEIGGEATTAEIAQQLLARGVETKSKRFVPTVYATLTNSKEFTRHGDKWALKKAR